VLRDGSRGHVAHASPEAVVGPGGGSWSHEARGGSGAVLCQETGAVGHVGMCIVFDLKLVRGHVHRL
jgi:hypothetical protein